ncbi:MAG: hypothetical protein RBS19_01035 [Bacteroidales bacterium]|nr:hypothetical protein [Bacteroidales bacterium]
MKVIFKYKFEVLLFVVMSGILFFYYHAIIMAPNHFIMSDSGDGLKNYYTIIMQLQSNELINFSYYNYPFGEYFFNTDGIPLLVTLLKPIQKIFPETYNYVPGILHSLLFLSMVFCSLFIYKILKLLNVQTFFALLSAISIALLQPQLARMGGHYALAFSHVIPLSFYLSLKYIVGNKKNRYAFWIFLHGFLSMFIHPYIGMMAFSSVVPILVFWLISNKNYLQKTHLFQILGAAFSPAIIYKLFTFITDTASDKNIFPAGFHDLKADWYTVFIPQTLESFNLFNLSSELFTTKWEAMAYVGLLTTLFLLPVVVLFLYKIHKTRKKNPTNIFLVGLLISSLLFLIISFGFPFYGSWSNFYQKIPLFREFRAIGRLAWIFYFGSTIFIISSLSYLKETYLQNKKISHLLAFLMFIIPLSYIYEAHGKHQVHSKFITKSENLFLEKSYSDEFVSSLEKIKSSNFQAIIPIPFFYVGTELLDVFRGLNTQDNSLISSKLLDLPLLTNFSGRSSFSVAKKILRIIEPNEVYKEISEDFLVKKGDFLIVQSYDELSKAEMKIIEKATFIDSTERFIFFRISPEQLFKFKPKTFPQNPSKFQNKNDWFIKDSLSIIYENNFENGDKTEALVGKASYSGPCKEYHILHEFDPNMPVSDSIISVSFWIKSGENYFDFASLNLIAFINRFDTVSQITYWDNAVYPHKSVLSFNGWTLVKLDFIKKCSKSNYSLGVKGGDGIEKKIYIDQLLIIKESAEAFRNFNHNLFFINNYVQSKTDRPFIYE